eukprot:gene44324-15452_t
MSADAAALRRELFAARQEAAEARAAEEQRAELYAQCVSEMRDVATRPRRNRGGDGRHYSRIAAAAAMSPSAPAASPRPPAAVVGSARRDAVLPSPPPLPAPPPAPAAA